LSNLTFPPSITSLGLIIRVLPLLDQGDFLVQVSVSRRANFDNANA
jgi:hypothetical protein